VRIPSGEQYEIAHGDQRVVVTEVGAGLRSYEAGGRDVLDGYGADEMASSGRGQVLVPWPNRIEGGRYEWRGRSLQLPLTEPEGGNAIHGLVRWSAWRVVEQEPHRLVLGHGVHPQPGYPFALDLRVEYALSEDGLRVETTATNVGAEPCPYGAGAHPYLAPGTPTVDTATLRLPARRVLETDAAGIPVGRTAVEGTPFDFRDPLPVGDTALDHCFTDLDRDADGRARVTLGDPGSGRAVALWVDERYPYLMLYTGDARPDVARRSLAVEPMTCPPNAFSSGESVIELAPGTSAAGSWGLSPGRSPTPSA
jgi:aldose 1-epimerase